MKKIISFILGCFVALNLSISVANSAAMSLRSRDAFGLKQIARRAEGEAFSITSSGKPSPADRRRDKSNAEGPFKLLIFGESAPDNLSIAAKNAGCTVPDLSASTSDIKLASAFLPAIARQNAAAFCQ